MLRLKLRTDGHALVSQNAPEVIYDKNIRDQFGIEDQMVVLIRSGHADGVFNPCLLYTSYYLILGYIIDYQIKGMLRDMDLSMTPVFAGLMIIFIAWVMDEGRKIQEEQELTV